MIDYEIESKKTKAQGLVLALPESSPAFVYYNKGKF